MSRTLVPLSLLLSLCANASYAEGVGHALLVAVPADQGNKLARRQYAEADVAALAAALPRAGYPAQNVVILAGAQAKTAPTAANLRRELAVLAKRSKAGDRVLIAVCGHAVQAKGEKETYLVPGDGKLTDGKTLVPLAELYREVAKCPASLRLVLLDVCRPAPTDAKPALEPVCRPQEQPVPAGVAVLFANAAGQQGQEVADLKRGAFFAAVVRAFQGEAGDGALTLRKLQAFVEDQTPKLVKTAKLKEQTPVLAGKVEGSSPVATFAAGPAGIGAYHVPALARLPRLPVEPTRRRLTFLAPGGAADAAGLKRDDVILAIGGRDVPDEAAFDALMGKYAPGDRVVFVVWRGGEPVEKAVTLQRQDPEGFAQAVLKAAAGDDPEAWHVLAWLLANGRGVKADAKEAVKWYRKAAEAGHPMAQANLGTLYRSGKGVEKDAKEAVGWMRKSAEQGLACGQLFLGHAYRYGIGVDKDDAEAAKWYRTGAEQGDPDSLLELGYAYSVGLGVKKDGKEAVALYLLAARGGSTQALYNLGWHFANGDGVGRDDVESARWYGWAAERGHAAAMNNLGVAYDTGKGVSRDAAEATRWYRKAADLDNVVAMNNLGRNYEYGNGVARSLSEAVGWYRKAAAKGYADGQMNVGRMYDEGLGVDQDHEEAAVWFTKAAEQGRAEAQRKVGLMFLSGRGVRKSRETAIGWLKQAAAGGDETARAKLKALGVGP